MAAATRPTLLSRTPSQLAPDEEVYAGEAAQVVLDVVVGVDIPRIGEV